MSYSPTLNMEQLVEQLKYVVDHVPAALNTTPVRLVINGVAHSVDMVWFEPRQDGGRGAVCIGLDPR